jgi:phage tail sheath protein FI
VYVEEVSFRSKSIEGVSTTTTGFVGPTRYGPVDLEPDIVTSLGEFERVYGDGQQLKFNGTVVHNYMWHAVRAFFEEGGRRLYVARTFKRLAATPDGLNADGRGAAKLPADATEPVLSFKSAHPGAAGNQRVRFTVEFGPNVLGGTATQPTVSSLLDRDVVWIKDQGDLIANGPGAGKFYLAQLNADTGAWTFLDDDNSTTTPDISLSQLKPDADPTKTDEVRRVTLSVRIGGNGGNGEEVWPDIAPDPQHVGRDGSQTSLSTTFALSPAEPQRARALPMTLALAASATNGLRVLRAFPATFLAALSPAASEPARTFTLQLTGGHDGAAPDPAQYEGTKGPDDASPGEAQKLGLRAFEDIEDISIVAAPGSTKGFNADPAKGSSIQNALISHCQRMRYRIAVLDSGDGQTISQVRAMRGKMDSSHAALYYPWIRILDPITRQQIHVPPSGAIAGIYARNDIARGVYKAPANEVLNTAIGLEQTLNQGQQDVLNPEGVNCLRFFEGRGFRVWGARTISSDPEWKYVNLRRYFAYLERSVDRGTQWVVFEPNGERLWANVRRTVEDFLLNEWQSGALLGDKPEKAFFVRCDRSTMTQNDLDNGRLICLVGVAPLRPAEFVIFRIGQWTGDRRG